MTAPASLHASSSTRRLLVRMNSTLFHCLGAAVLLEQAACARAGGDAPMRACDERHERARRLRGYVAGMWPEFEWDAACRAVSTGFGAYSIGMDGDGSGQAAVFYAALSRIAEEPALRDLLTAMASAATPRRECRAAGRVLHALRRVEAICSAVRHMREGCLRRAFDVLQQHWVDAPPFPAQDYADFLSRAYALLAPHADLDWGRRMIYRSAMNRGLARSTTTRSRAPRSVIGTGRASPAAGPAHALPRACVVR